MNILKNKGVFVLLTEIEDLKNQLTLIERAGRTCYQSDRGNITPETARKFIKKILKRGHESVIEHSSMVVVFKNLSRGFTHEQVRHRITSISQESTRFVDYAKEGDGPDLDSFCLNCIVPPHKNEHEKVLLDDGRLLSMAEMFQQIEMFYRALRKNGYQLEDARQILPIGIKSEIVISANFREWRHIFGLRCAKPAHWEIRGVMGKLLTHIKVPLSPIFDDFVWAGKCGKGVDFFKKDPSVFRK